MLVSITQLFKSHESGRAKKYWEGDATGPLQLKNSKDEELSSEFYSCKNGKIGRIHDLANVWTSGTCGRNYK